jgi:hypothetical protein
MFRRRGEDPIELQRLTACAVELRELAGVNADLKLTHV